MRAFYLQNMFFICIYVINSVNCAHWCCLLLLPLLRTNKLSRIFAIVQIRNLFSSPIFDFPIHVSLSCDRWLVVFTDGDSVIAITAIDTAIGWSEKEPENDITVDIERMTQYAYTQTILFLVTGATASLMRFKLTLLVIVAPCVGGCSLQCARQLKIMIKLLVYCEKISAVNFINIT